MATKQMSQRHRIFGLFADFDQAFAVVAGIRRYEVPGVTVDDVRIKSPIEHPEIEDVLGERPTNVPKFAFVGGLFGLVFGFFFLAGAQANFTVQPQGGKPVITIPTNLVLAYEMLILFGVLATLVGFIIGARLIRKRGPFYDKAVSLDQIGIVVERVDDTQRQKVRDLFAKHRVIDVFEETI